MKLLFKLSRRVAMHCSCRSALRCYRSLTLFINNRYGSNLDPATLKLRTNTPVLSEEARPVVLNDYALTINRGTAASVEPSAGARVEGLLYTLSPRTFAQLCATEGVPLAYRMEQVDVADNEGTVIDCLTFISGRGLQTNKTSKRYKDLLLKGARENGLSNEYIENVLNALEV